MHREIITGTILGTTESSTKPGTLIRVQVAIPGRGSVQAVLGPGAYRITPVGSLNVGQEVVVSMQPVPTVLGVVEDVE